MCCTCPGKRKRTIAPGDLRWLWRVLQRPTEWCEDLGYELPRVHRTTWSLACLRCGARWNSRAVYCAQLVEATARERADLAAGRLRDGQAARLDRATAHTEPELARCNSSSSKNHFVDFKARAAGDD